MGKNKKQIMKQYAIDRLIDLHKKQTCILELMNGERGTMLELLTNMYMQNQERIFHLLKLTNEYKETTADISRS